MSFVMRMPQIGIIVLAAGASIRMGEPKQLLRFEGKTLLRRAVNAARDSRCHPVVVVLGSEADALQNEISETAAHIVVNQAWAEGMGASIRCGIAALEARSMVEAVVLTLCDQPFITADVINRLLDAYQTGRPPLVAAEYEVGGERTIGVPALFSRALFGELLNLRGTEGAKRVIARHRNEAAVIQIPEAAFDVDTPHDYRVLQNTHSLSGD